MGVAIITPFTETNEVDYAALERLVDLHLNSGTDFLCVQGTTGETPTLTMEEKRTIRKRIIKQVDGRMGIMLGCGGNNTQAVINELQTEDFTGVDGILCVVPYYNKPNQEGMYRHFKAIADSTSLPIYLYNVPGRTGVNMHPETTVRLARECKNIVGFKAASGNLDQIKRLIALKPETLDVLSGDDALTVELVKRGGNGVISVAANTFPEKFCRCVHDAMEGKIEEAEAEMRELEEPINLLFKEGNPVGAKSMTATMGLTSAEVRLPLVEATEVLAAEIKTAIKKYDLR
jgi:4-hydroxy-tetrahydrodipicolinate synthase